MTPVDATRISDWKTPSAFAAARAVSWEVRSPARPVQALALPELTITARARPPLARRFCRERTTGAAATRFVVKTPAPVVPGASEKINARSSALLTFLIPAATAAPRNPAGVARLPSMGSHFGIYVQRLPVTFLFPQMGIRQQGIDDCRLPIDD